jgi:hypothetical protein
MFAFATAASAGTTGNNTTFTTRMQQRVLVRASSLHAAFLRAVTSAQLPSMLT